MKGILQRVAGAGQDVALAHPTSGLPARSQDTSGSLDVDGLGPSAALSNLVPGGEMEDPVLFYDRRSQRGGIGDITLMTNASIKKMPCSGRAPDQGRYVVASRQKLTDKFTTEESGTPVIR